MSATKSVALPVMVASEPHPCARCASMRKTCCQRAEILVTAGDVARIARRTGRAEFVENRAPADPEYLEHDADDPDWRRLTVRSDGARRVLKRRESGDCVFLGAEGCTLGTEVRPLVCRLYPWAYTEAGLTGEDSEYCPVEALRAVGKDGRGTTMLTILKMDRVDAERWRRRLYEELRTGEESGCESG